MLEHSEEGAHIQYRNTQRDTVVNIMVNTKR